MPEAKFKYAFIGAGKMAETLIRGLLSSETVRRNEIIGTRRHAERLKNISGRLQIATTLDNRQAVRDADVVILGVKPQTANEVLQELADELRADQLLISVVAGVSIAQIESQLNAKVPVVRAMPNTPSQVSAGMAAICGGTYAGAQHVETARALFQHIGRVLVLDEVHFDAVTGLSASGPAFIYIVIESLAEGGVKAGLPRDVATELAAQTCLGAAKMVIETGEHPAVLKDMVTTPAGCTIDGILKLEEGGVRVTLIKAIVEAATRAQTLVD